jgi:hypothetical protein
MDVLLVTIPNLWTFCKKAILKKDVIQTAIGYHESGVRVIFCCKVHFAAFLDKVIDTEERKVACEGKRKIF